ncbi:MAG: hypothetical protein LBU22_12695 [Dysgonamonadaceae bacterium]|jgi:hypothetical protein|nr:hypothetical protein [Dysgonamonadaceae bacterium]
MKTIFKYIFTCISFLFIFSCSNDFLSENAELSSSTVVETMIVVSPDWEVGDYPVSVDYAGNAKFRITSAPKWLDIVENTGQFNNGLANIRLGAIPNSDFSEVGIYIGLMILEVESKGLCQVSVAYINEGNPVIETESNLSFGYNSGQETFLSIKNNGEGILIWEITEHPEWIIVQSVIDYYPSNILPQKMESRVHLSYNPEAPLPENPTGQIVIRSNDKNRPEVVVKIDFDYGSPSLYCYNDNLDFGRTETTLTIELSNQGNGILVWSIEDCPEWLTATETSGTMYPYEWTYLSFTCDRSRMPAGHNSAVLKLKTNDKKTPVYEITVKARNGNTNPENIIGIEGKITDAWMDKKTDLLYLTTAQPNRFLAYDTKTKTIARTLNLSNAPNCFSVSEDENKVIIGHSGKISFIDMDNFSMIKTTDVNHDVFDIEWGADDWCCYTPGQTVQHYDLIWINVLTGEKKETPYGGYGSLYGGSMIKKIPNQNYIVASRLNLSPTGICIFDITTNLWKNYFHESIYKFWFSVDGNYLFSSNKDIYRTSAFPFHEDTFIAPIGQFKYNENGSISWIDHSEATNSLWVLPDYYFYESNLKKILQLETNDYTLVNTYYYDDYYKTSTSVEYPVQAHYVFANGKGTELIVIRNVTENYDINAWSLEHIPVTK